MAIDTFDTIDGVHILYDSKNPDDRHFVVSLIGFDGRETNDPEKAAGGVVQESETCFRVFVLPGGPDLGEDDDGD